MCLQYPCQCGRNCESFYPCLLLYSRVESAHMDQTVSQWPVVLYDSDWQQIFVNNADEDLRQRVSGHVSPGHQPPEPRNKTKSSNFVPTRTN